MLTYPLTVKVVDVGGDQTGGVEDPLCIKIGYSSRIVPRAEKDPLPCIKVGYVPAMY